MALRYDLRHLNREYHGHLSIFGATIGIWIALLMNDHLLQLIFGCFILVVAMREGYGFFHRLHQKPRTTAEPSRYPLLLWRAL
jgi:uncharacterized membrane protein YfcA